MCFTPIHVCKLGSARAHATGRSERRSRPSVDDFALILHQKRSQVALQSRPLVPLVCCVLWSLPDPKIAGIALGFANVANCDIFFLLATKNGCWRFFWRLSKFYHFRPEIEYTSPVLINMSTGKLSCVTTRRHG